MKEFLEEVFDGKADCHEFPDGQAGFEITRPDGSFFTFYQETLHDERGLVDDITVTMFDSRGCEIQSFTIVRREWK